MIKFQVDEKKKKMIHQRFIRSKPGLYLCPFMMILLAVIFSATVLIYGQVDGSIFIVRDITDPDYGSKDFMTLAFVVGTVDIIFLFLALIARLAIKRFTGKNLGERVHESLICENHVLIYGYQNYAKWTKDDRVIVCIPLNRQKQITYEKNVGKICFSGFYSSSYYEDYRTKQTRADGSFEDGDFILFDYFCPSLVDTLKSLGMEGVGFG